MSEGVLTRFIKHLGAFPYVPARHTYRLADYFLNANQDRLEVFLQELLALRKMLVCCDVCCAWREQSGSCFWCGPARDQSCMCVVETWTDAYALERSGLFKGVYHVLGGALSPVDGITPDVLSFKECIKRFSNGMLNELIIATNQTPEGEATASYLLRLIHQSGAAAAQKLSITHLASGIPVGSSLEYVDRLTLGKALAHRRQA